MRSAKDFFRPLAVGAPEPVREIPARPSRVIHFFPAVERQDGRQGARHRAHRRHPAAPTSRTACPSSDKEAARAGLVEVGKAWTPGETQLWTRVNSLDSPWCLDDLVTAVTEVGDKLDVIMIPKVEGPEDIHYVDRLLAQLEAKAGLDPADPRARHPRDGPRRGQRRGDLRAPRPACRACRSAPPTWPPTAA